MVVLHDHGSHHAIYMNGYVQLTIIMTTALSLTAQPLAEHFVATWLTSSFVSGAALAQAS